MRTYVITGGVNGIGRATADILRSQGHRVVVIDNEGGDIVADLSTTEGRTYAVAEIHRLLPEGIDGLACVAGISTPKKKNSTVLAVNYYGAIAVANGLFDLLQKRQGSCVMTASASLSWINPDGGGHIAELLNSSADEERVAELVDAWPLDCPYSMYLSSKLALARWARRNSIEWAVDGVRLSIIAPGCVDTRLGNAPASANVNESFHFTIPPYYKDGCIMPPNDIGNVLSFLLSPESKGISGGMVYTDAGQEAFYHTDKVY